VVVTHAVDFGTLARRVGHEVVGIIYLRPGHIQAAEVLRPVDAALALDINARAPFILIVDQRGEGVRVRLRSGARP
jgi:hypothetical protein